MIMNRLRVVYGIAESDLRQQIRSGLFLSNIVVSILFTLILGYALGTSGSLHNLPVDVYDPGHLIAFKNNDLLSIHAVQTEDEGVNDIKTGQAVAAAIVQNNTVQLVIDETNGNALNGGVAQELTLQIIASLQPALAQSMQNGGIKVQPLYGLDTQSSVFQLRLLAAQLMPIAVFLFTLVLAGENLIVEKRNHTLFELAMAPVREIWIVLGKMLSGAITVVCVIGLVLLVTRFVFGVEITGNIFALLLANLVMGLGFMGLSYLLSSVFPQAEMYRGFVSLVFVFPALFFSGIFNSLWNFPGFVRAIVNVFPLEWCVNVVKSVTFKQANFADVSHNLLLLTAFLAVTIILGPLSMRRVLIASRKQ